MRTETTPTQRATWCPRLDCWLREALQEAGCSGEPTAYSRDYAILPKRLFDLVGSLPQEKKYDFCFIGSFGIRPAVAEARQWLLEFVGRNFGSHSFLQFTDSATRSNHVPLGDFDYTLTRSGFVPREVPLSERGYLDTAYYEIMCKSRFVLCPGGDAPWSMRFYEALICRAIPIVVSIPEAARTEMERELNCKAMLTDGDFIYRQEWADHNFSIALKWHSFLVNSPSSREHD